MNQVILIGRLTRDPELSYTPNTQSAMCRFTIAVDRPRRQGEDAGADFIRITVWGRQAETCDRYLAKGRQVAVQGRIQTGSYKNREGVTVYTTDVVADRVEFLGGGQSDGGQGGFRQNNSSYNGGQGSYGGGQNSSFNGGYQGRDNRAPQSGGTFSAPEETFGADNTSGSQDFGFGGFDDLPDTFQAAEDDIPF